MREQEEINKELVRRWVDEVFNEADADAAEEVIAAEFTEHALAPFGSVAPGTVHGPAHARSTVETLRRQFPDVRMRIDSLVGDGDLVAVRVTATGTHLGPLTPGIPASGRTFIAAQSHWFRIADGRITEHWATRDDLTTMRQLGIVATPGAPPQAPADPSPASSGISS